MADTLASLIERLEKLTGPDRELDAQIGDAVGFDPRECCGNGVAVTNHRGDEIVGQECCGNPNIIWPSFTASIDAALTLVPEGHRWLVGSAWKDQHGDCPSMATVCIAGDYGVRPATAATPELALCIAALRARSSLTPETKT